MGQWPGVAYLTIRVILEQAPYPVSAGMSACMGAQCLLITPAAFVALASTVHAWSLLCLLTTSSGAFQK